MKGAKMKVELMFCEEIILQEIEDKHSTRKDVAITYAFCIDSSEDVHFGKINNAIVSRWSYSALHYIKRRAWKLRKGIETERMKWCGDKR